MKFYQRFAFFLFGLLIGIIFLIYFLEYLFRWVQFKDRNKAQKLQEFAAGLISSELTPLEIDSSR